MTERFLYGGKPAETRSAAGVKGTLIRTADGAILFRVYESGDRFTDYEIRHDDLGVTIDAEELAAFYRVGGRDVLDHAPQVLGLTKASGADGERT